VAAIAAERVVRHLEHAGKRTPEIGGAALGVDSPKTKTAQARSHVWAGGRSAAGL
jgi:hypothetical protein